MNGWVGVKMSTPTDYLTLSHAGGPSVRSPAVLTVIPGPDVIPPAGSSGAVWTFKVDQDITLQGWDLRPRGNVAGLSYAFVMSGLNANAEATCKVRLTITEHTANAVKFRVSRTGEMPAACLQTTLFKPQGGTYFPMMFNATYNGVTSELWKQSYYLIP